MAGNCKYYKQEQYVSFDSGQTWSGTGVYQQGALIVSASTDCGYVPPPHDYSTQYLTFRPHGDTEFWFSYGDSGNYNMISYSLNSGQSWTVVDHNEHTVTVHSGETVMWRCRAENLGGEGAGIGTFHSSGSTWEVEGNIMSLLYWSYFIGQTSLNAPDVWDSSYVFSHLFCQCTGLTSAENMVLPATSLAFGCYYSMFEGCTSLTTAPNLPATTLAIRCYEQMFRNCYSLTTAPELSATTLANACYIHMFQNCTSLTTPPELPATTLASNCYDGMFSYCTGLTTPPELPATTLAEGCYWSMFNQCTSLTTAPTLSATTLVSYCYHWMFWGCTNLSSITCLATDISAYECTSEWLYDVAASGTFTTPSSTNWTSGKDGIPIGWTRVDI